MNLDFYLNILLTKKKDDVAKLELTLVGFDNFLINNLLKFHLTHNPRFAPDQPWIGFKNHGEK